jgi:hypothetical protein
VSADPWIGWLAIGKDGDLKNVLPHIFSAEDMRYEYGVDCVGSRGVVVAETEN